MFRSLVVDDNSGSHIFIPFYFKQRGDYLNIGADRMKKGRILFQPEKVELWNVQYFVGNKTEIIQLVLKMQEISLFIKYTK